MKKTMIALATIAAVGAASAQVSITGEAEWGYQSKTDANGVTVSGIGSATAQLKFAASEDLGNGMKASAGLSLNTGSFGAGASSDDQSISLTTPMATIALATSTSADWVSQASGAATWNGLDGKVLGARSARDSIAVVLPLATGLTGTLSYAEAGGKVAWGTGSDGRPASEQPIYGAALKYATGPATLQAAFVQFVGVNKLTDGSNDTLTRLGGKVDLGVAMVGAGLQIGKTGAGGTNTQTALSVSAPLPGNFSAQAVFGSNNMDSSTGEATVPIGRRTGYMLGLQYNLSKRTYAVFNAGSWTGVTAANASAFALSSTTGAIGQTAASATASIDSAATSMYYMSLVHDF